jgi:hypothetical protein
MVLSAAEPRGGEAGRGAYGNDDLGVDPALPPPAVGAGVSSRIAPTMRLPPLLAVAALALPAFVRAQIPSHATLLNPISEQRDLRVLHDGDDVHAIGHDYARVLHARSRDGGRTWPLREAQLGLATVSRFEVVLAGPGQLLVVATSTISEPTAWRSGDAGTTWSPTPPLFPGSMGLGQLALTANGPEVLAARLTGTGALSVRRSLDGGAS